MDTRAGKEVHDLISFVGLRAHATTVALLRLSAELVKAGALDDEAINSIKTSIIEDLELTRPMSVNKMSFIELREGGSTDCFLARRN